MNTTKFNLKMKKNCFTFAFVLKYLSLTLCLMLVCNIGAQTKRPELEKNVRRNTVLIGPTYGRMFTIGNLAKRFGGSNTIGINAAYKFGNNFQVSGNFSGWFGDNVKERGMLDSMIGSGGELLDINGNFAPMRLYQRGYLWHLDIGKIIPTGRINPNSGILISAGLGFMQHKIKFMHQLEVLPQLEGEYTKGYDRLTNGLMTRLFVGYQAIDENQMLNFHAGLEWMSGFTRNQRAFNFDTRTAETSLRRDNMIGLKVGLSFSIQGRKTGTRKGQEDKFFE